MFSIVLVAALSTAAQTTPPASWTCEDALFADGACDCGCGANDDDCASSNFAACEREACAPGQAPWEHENSSCMSAACGDGWRSEDEACDDFNALASGGCNADCSAVNDGFTCGEGAEGCEADPVAGEGEGEGEGEPAEGEGEGEDDEDDEAGGCASTPAFASVLALIPVLRRRRR